MTKFKPANQKAKSKAQQNCYALDFAATDYHQKFFLAYANLKIMMA